MNAKKSSQSQRSMMGVDQDSEDQPGLVKAVIEAAEASLIESIGLTGEANSSTVPSISSSHLSRREVNRFAFLLARTSTFMKFYIQFHR